MRRILLVTLPCLALAAMSLPARADSNSDTIERYYRLQATGLVTLTPDGLTHIGDIVGSEAVVNALGEVVDRLPFQAKAADRPLGQTISHVPCVQDTKGRQGFTAYLPPVVYSIDKKNEKGSFQFNFYSQDGARQDQFKQPTLQVLSCAVGGVDAGNGSRITVSGPGVAFNDAQTPRKLGHNWKEGKTPKDYSISLGFQVPTDAVTVTGGIQQNPANYLKGSVVPPYEYGDMAQFHDNARLVGGRLPAALPPLERQRRLPGLCGRGSVGVPPVVQERGVQPGLQVRRISGALWANPLGC